LYDVVSLDSGNFIACGDRRAYGRSSPLGGDFYLNIALVKFNSRGDTLWIKNTGFYGDKPRMCKGPNNTVYVAFCNPYFSSTSSSLFIVKFDGNGNLLNTWPIQGTPGFSILEKIITATDGSIIFIGANPPPFGTPGILDMVVGKVEPTNGFLLFNNQYSDHPYSLATWIEETPDGTFIASGTAGSRIWAVEIDSNGVELQRQTFYRTPTQALLDQFGAVQQAPDGRFIVSGMTISYSPFFYFLGSFGGSFAAPTRIWGGEKPGVILPTRVQADGSLLVFTADSFNYYFSRLRADSSEMWKVLIQSQLTIKQPILKAFAYSGDSIGIAVGSLDDPNTFNADEEFYFCRIRGLGQPFNPTSVKPKGRKAGLPPLIAYPTPTEGNLTVHTRSKLPLQLTTITGQVLETVQPLLDGTTEVDLRAYPAGLYFLRQGSVVVRVVLN
jgi:hypothetical protein